MSLEQVLIQFVNQALNVLKHEDTVNVCIIQCCGMMLSDGAKLKSAIYTDARKICREVGIYLNMEYESNALDVIAELTWKKLQSFGSDLEAFQKHAKRSTITADDVKLLVRKSDSLKALVDEKVKEIAKTKAEVKVGKRKRKSSPSSTS